MAVRRSEISIVRQKSSVRNYFNEGLLYFYREDNKEAFKEWGEDTKEMINRLGHNYISFGIHTDFIFPKKPI